MLEALPRKESHDSPRASVLALPGELAPAGIWMGGAHTPLGEQVELDVAGKAWFFDLAGDMPASYRSAAGRWFVRVFPDVEGVPHRYDLLGEMVRELAADLRAGGGPDHVYVMCQHGMNRSGLVSGLLLREMGLGGEEALERIVTARPGALSNQSFRQLVMSDE